MLASCCLLLLRSAGDSWPFLGMLILRKARMARSLPGSSPCSEGSQAADHHTTEHICPNDDGTDSVEDKQLSKQVTRNLQAKLRICFQKLTIALQVWSANHLAVPKGGLRFWPGRHVFQNMSQAQKAEGLGLVVCSTCTVPAHLSLFSAAACGQAKLEQRRRKKRQRNIIFAFPFSGSIHSQACFSFFKIQRPLLGLSAVANFCFGRARAYPSALIIRPYFS